MECGISEVEDMTDAIVDAIVEWGWDRFWVSRILLDFPAFGTSESGDDCKGRMDSLRCCLENGPR